VRIASPATSPTVIPAKAGTQARARLLSARDYPSPATPTSVIPAKAGTQYTAHR